MGRTAALARTRVLSTFITRATTSALVSFVKVRSGGGGGWAGYDVMCVVDKAAEECAGAGGGR